MSNQLLFVYGTLMELSVQLKVLGREIAGVPDQLTDFTLGKITINGSEYKIIRPKERDKVVGVVLSVSDKDLEETDTYETTAYYRKQVVLVSGKKAWTYVEHNL